MAYLCIGGGIYFDKSALCKFDVYSVYSWYLS